MRRNIDGTCSPSCCSNPNIRTINTMNADTQGNFTIRGDQGIHVTVGTNEVIISGIAMYYDNTDGNIVIDNDLLTINLADDITITGDMIIAGDLTVNGTYYTVHAEHVYTQDDYIILREGATTPLGAGSYAGFQVTKYDGTNDGRLVIDNSGVARVGDVGDEQPLLTRDESADLTNEDLLTWDSTDQKAVGIPRNTFGIPNTVTSGSGNVSLVSGSTTKVAEAAAPASGTYLIAVRFEIRTNPSSTQSYNISVSVNGANSVIVQTSGYWTDTFGRLTAVDVRTLTAGDNVELNAYQNLGSSPSGNGDIYLIRIA